MNPRNARVLVFATALLTVPLFEALAQGPRHPRQPQTKPQPKEPQVIIKETPIEEDPHAQDVQAQNQGQPAQPPQGMAPQDPAAAPPAQDPNAAQQQGIRDIRYVPQPEEIARLIHRRRRDMSGLGPNLGETKKKNPRRPDHPHIPGPVSARRR